MGCSWAGDELWEGKSSSGLEQCPPPNLSGTKDWFYARQFFQVWAWGMVQGVMWTVGNGRCSLACSPTAHLLPCHPFLTSHTPVPGGGDPWCRGHQGQSWLIWKDPEAGKDWGREEKGMTEDEIIGWHHWLSGHGFGWTPGVGDGQGGLVCCNSWSRKESHTTELLNWTELIVSRDFSGYTWLRSRLYIIQESQ